MATIPPQPTDESWRPQLLATLQNCGVETKPKSRFANGFLYFFVSLAVVGAGRVIGFLVDQGTRGNPDEALVALSLEVLFDIFVLGWIRSRFAIRNAQARAYSAEQILQKPGSPRPIFYLRSFLFDDRISHIGLLQLIFSGVVIQNPEQRMVTAFTKIGPVIAIGRPGEKLPALGAARFYVTHELWKQKVSEVAALSRFVVWATGSTEGLRWEISHLLENLPPEKLILLAHPHLLKLPDDQREAEWRAFLQSIGTLFPIPLPTRLGDTRFFFFGPGWQPFAVAPPKDSLIADIRSGFNPQDRAQKLLIALKTTQLSATPYAIHAQQSSAEPVFSQRSFSALIGARPSFQPPRLLIFYLALVFSHTMALLANPFFFSRFTAASLLTPVVNSAYEAAAVFFAFRFIYKNAKASALASLLTAIFGFIFTMFSSSLSHLISPTYFSQSLYRFFTLFFFYWILSAACDRIKRTWFALLLAPIMIATFNTFYLAVTNSNYFIRKIVDDPNYYLFQILYVITFAAILNISLYLTPASPQSPARPSAPPSPPPPYSPPAPPSAPPPPKPPTSTPPQPPPPKRPPPPTQPPPPHSPPHW
jgi:hypothetical protein